MKHLQGNTTMRLTPNRLILVGACSAIALATAAHAQDTGVSAANDPVAPQIAGVEQDTPAQDEIIVTGSRISRLGDETPNPVVTISAESLQRSGNVNVIDTLSQNPALLGSVTTQAASGSNATFGAVGVNLLNLRNLGTNRTLVLINGRRHVGSVAGTAAVDTNTIPTDLIEGVDVLTGGASAIYGADGVSGVVNFRLKRNFEGLTARAQMDIPNAGDATQRFASVTAGRNFADGRGNIALSYEYRQQARVSSFDRRRYGDPLRSFGLVRDPNDIPDDPTRPDRVLTNNLRYADSSTDGAIDLDFDGIPDYTGSGKVYDRGRLLPSSGGLTQGGDSTPLAGYQGDLQAYSRVHNVNLLTHFDVSDAFSIYAEGKYVRQKTRTQAQPSFDFFTFLSPDNAYLQDRFGDLAPDGALISRDNFDLGVRGENNDRETIRGVIGFEGRISDHARYDLSYTFGQTKSDILLTNYRITDRYFAAIDAVTNPATGQVVCRSTLFPNDSINPDNFGGAATTFTPGAGSNCQPLNLLGNSVRSQSALDFVNANIRNSARLQQHVLSGAVSGDFGALFELPGGPIGFAVGAEYRKEKSSFTPDLLLQEGALADFSVQLPERGSFDVREVFGELQAPILKDLRFAHLLSVGAAIRLSDYSTVGKTTTWKVDGSYAPVRDILFRGTYSQAVRAPNVTELFAPRNGGFNFVSDPCDPVFLPEGTSFRAANCQAVLAGAGLTPAQIASFNPENDPQATVSLPGFSGGNRDLREETARTWTAGVVLTPTFIPGLSLSLDWYDIKLKNAINTPTTTELAELCVDQPTLDNVYCANITRASGTGYIASFFVQPQNVANFRTSGADVRLVYSFSPSPSLGQFNLTAAGGYLNKLEFIPTPGATLDVDREEPGAPKWNATGDITWIKGAFSLNYGLTWFSKTRRYTIEQLNGNPDLTDPRYFRYKEKWQHDVQVAFDVNERFRFYAGANNLFNQQPSIAAVDQPVSFLGRVLYAGARVTYGGK
jgi:outer membrane receptor protein involved in Fe transport